MNLEGDETPILPSQVASTPALRHTASVVSPQTSDLYITVQVFASSKPLTVPVQTAYKNFKSERRWNEWLTLPVKYSQLPLDACLAITLWDLSPDAAVHPEKYKDARGHAVPFGGTTLALFGKDNHLLKGRQKCLVHRGRKADGNGGTETPALVEKKRRRGDASAEVVDSDRDEMERMEKLFKKHEMGEIPRVDWLDQLVFRGVEKKGAQATKTSLRRMQMTQAVSEKDGEPRASSYTLNVELPRFDFPIVFSDHEYPTPPISALQHLAVPQSSVLRAPPEVQFGPGINAISESSTQASRLIKIYDPEIGARENPAETKHRRLFRSSHRHGIMDKDLRPNSKVRDELNAILSYPPTHVLSPEETDLVWKFRYHLTRDKRALTKFVKSVNWQDVSEAKQAIQVISRWTDIDIDDALELLGPGFDNPAVRAYAVERLRKADDAELLLYLLQLVQALKFEHIAAEAAQNGATQDSSLARFLISRAAANSMLGNYLHWYLMVECDDQSPEQGDDNRNVYRKVAYDFMVELVKLPSGAERRKILLRQAELITVLSKISSEVKTSHETIAKKTERVKAFLADPKNEMIKIEPPLPLPLDPSIELTGVVPEQTTVFKSSLCPIKVTFKTLAPPTSPAARKPNATPKEGTYPIIFKTGDDLRQDQLVIQIITLMDRLLQKENLDLKLSPYKILATSTTAGASQFVPSASLSSIASKYKSNPALAYLKYYNPDERGPLGLRQETLDTYIKSCAGYCVITYILGVGDRHLDNLLLSPDGHFFHADFGFILGRDPKPFAPAMKLSKEMVDCMGGTSSPHYRQFKQYCFLAYSALRKSSGLILNLFSLMTEANIPDIRMEPDKAVLKVRERFHLDVGEEEACRVFERVMDDCLTAYAPVVIDKLHELVQAFRT